MENKMDELAKALVNFHKTVPPIVTNKTVDYGKGSRKFKYVDLCGIWDVIRKPLSEAGLVVLQTFDGNNLITTLLHESGQSISSMMGLNIGEGSDHKMIGAAISYMRRYMLVSILSLVADEDDNKAEEVGASVMMSTGSQGKKAPLNLDQLEEIASYDDGSEECFGLMNRILKFNGKERLADVPADQFQSILAAFKTLRKK